MVSRVIQIIEHLAQNAGSPTLADLVRSTGLPKSTLHRLLAMLARQGVVARHGTTYRLGDRLVELTRLRDRSALALRRLLMPCLTDLYHRIGMIVSLAALATPEVILLETLYGDQHRSAALRLPERAPANQTAAGRLLLALRSDGSRLDRELMSIRKAGIAVGYDEHLPGMSTVAVAVAGRAGKPMAALTVCGPAGCADLTQVTTALRRAGHAASLTVRGASDRRVEHAIAGV